MIYASIYATESGEVRRDWTVQPKIPEHSPSPQRQSWAVASTAQDSKLSIYMGVIAICILVTIMAAVIFLLCKRFRRRPPSKAENIPDVIPVVHFDRPNAQESHRPRITITEEPIEFVLPALQSPRTFKAGASRFELSSPDIQKSLYEPIAREYQAPSVGFSVEITPDSRRLTVRLNSAKDLPPSKLGVNPCVKVTLIPDKVKFLSRVQKNTTRPVFGEVFHFEIEDGIESKSIKFTVYNYEKRGRRIIIGTTQFALKDSIGDGEKWLALDTTMGEQTYGEVTLHLKQTADAFICRVVNARDLPTDVLIHIKMGVYINQKPYKKIKTHSFIALGAAMDFNESIEVQKSSLSSKETSNLQIILALYQRKKRLAKCHVGPRSSVDGIEHWAEMLTKNEATRAHRFLPV